MAISCPALLTRPQFDTNPIWQSKLSDYNFRKWTSAPKPTSISKLLFFFWPLVSFHSNLPDERDPHRLHRRHHEPVTGQRLPPLWVVLVGGQSRAGLQHHLHYRALPDQPPVWRAGDLWWWVEEPQLISVWVECRGNCLLNWSQFVVTFQAEENRQATP